MNKNPNSFSYEELALSYNVDGNGWLLRRYGVELSRYHSDNPDARVMRD